MSRDPITIAVFGIGGGVVLTYDEDGDCYAAEVDVPLDGSVSIQLSRVVPREREPFWSCEISVSLHRCGRIDEFESNIYAPERDLALRVAIDPFQPMFTSQLKRALRGGAEPEIVDLCGALSQVLAHQRGEL